jgi:hypothetical protein
MSVPVSAAPTSKAKYIIGAIVMGLLIQTTAIAIGMLVRRQMQSKRQGSIWNGIGRKQQTVPHKMASDTLWEFICHRSSSFRKLLNCLNMKCFSRLLLSGIQFFLRIPALNSSSLKG